MRIAGQREIGERLPAGRDARARPQDRSTVSQLISASGTFRPAVACGDWGAMAISE